MVEWRYSFTILNSAVDSTGQLHASASLTLGKLQPARSVQEAGWAPEPVWTLCWRENLLLQPKIESQILYYYVQLPYIAHSLRPEYTEISL
jgi:hypothetical protein